MADIGKSKADTKSKVGAEVVAEKDKLETQASNIEVPVSDAVTVPDTNTVTEQAPVVKVVKAEKEGSSTKYTRDQWLTLAAAIAFLIGGVFMLVNVFGGQEWAFFVGLGIAVVASILMILGWLDNRKRVAANLVATAPDKTVK